MQSPGNSNGCVFVTSEWVGVWIQSRSSSLNHLPCFSSSSTTRLVHRSSAESYKLYLFSCLYSMLTGSNLLIHTMLTCWWESIILTAKCPGPINWLSMYLKWTRMSTKMRWVFNLFRVIILLYPFSKNNPTKSQWWSMCIWSVSRLHFLLRITSPY